MADTEIHYLTYDPDEIWLEMQTAYVEAGGDPLYPGDEKEMLLRSVQADIVQVFAGVDNALRMQTLRYATGDYLDLIGENRGCERLQAKAATGHVMFTYTDPTANASYKTIAKGTLLTADGIVNYALDQDVTLTAGSTVAYGTYTCTAKGVSGNGLTSGTQMLFVNCTNPLVTNISAAYDGSTGGRDEESDDDYRDRIRVWLQSAMSVGTKSQYEQAALDYDSNIKEAYATRVSSLVEIYITSEYADLESELAASLAQYLVTNDLTAIGVSTTVLVAPVKGYSLVLNLKMGSLTKTEIDSVIEEYTEWQNNVLGRSFCPEKLTGMLYAAGCKNVAISSTSTFDGGSTVKYTEVEDYERCDGTVSWTRVG